MAYYTTNSRSVPRPDSSEEKFTTQCIYVDSLAVNGAVAIPDRPYLSSGFTVTLSKPIVLDINTRYVMSLIKAEFDTTNLGNHYYSININTDLIEYQAENATQTQILCKIYKVAYNAAFYQTSTPFEYQAINPINRFIKSTTKVISQVSFTIDVDSNYAPSVPLNPPRASPYPTRICFVIKAVPPNVESTTII
jgi:hypothetical protein